MKVWRTPTSAAHTAERGSEVTNKVAERKQKLTLGLWWQHHWVVFGSCQTLSRSTEEDIIQVRGFRRKSVSRGYWKLNQSRVVVSRFQRRLFSAEAVAETTQFTHMGRQSWRLTEQQRCSIQALHLSVVLHLRPSDIMYSNLMHHFPFLQKAPFSCTLLLTLF